VASLLPTRISSGFIVLMGPSKRHIPQVCESSGGQTCDSLPARGLRKTLEAACRNDRGNVIQSRLYDTTIQLCKIDLYSDSRKKMTHAKARLSVPVVFNYHFLLTERRGTPCAAFFQAADVCETALDLKAGRTLLLDFQVKLH